MNVSIGPVTGECTAEETEDRDLNMEQNIAYNIDPKFVSFVSVDTMHSTSSRLPPKVCHSSNIMCSVHRCSQLESAIPVVDIYDDVFGDIDHTYSTIPDIDPTNDQQRYSVYKIL